MGGKEVEFRYEKRFRIDPKHRKVTWTVPLSHPKRAILRIYFTKVTDPYSRILEVRVNGKLAARQIVMKPRLPRIHPLAAPPLPPRRPPITPRAPWNPVFNISHVVSHGDNAIEVYISCMAGYWEGKLILETLEVLPENPVELFAIYIAKWFAGAKLSPAEQVAIATSTLFPVGAIIAAAEIGYSAYQAYKKAKAKGLVK